MTDEQIRITEKYIKENRPHQYTAGCRLKRQLVSDNNHWDVRVSYERDYDIYITDEYHARASVRVEHNGTYTITVCDEWLYHGITVENEVAASQIVRLELEHMRYTMPHLYRK